jgi:predicted phage-related endonuclease
MVLTAKQRAERHQYLGATDIAALLGVPYDGRKNAYDVWLEKTQRIEPEDREPEHQRAGNLFESGVLAFAQEELGELVTDEDQLEVPWIGFPVVVHLDSYLKATREPVDAKAIGIYGPSPHEWGMPGTDQVPDYVLVQMHAQMGATNTERAYVAAFIGFSGFRIYIIEKDETIFQEIMDVSVDFWDNYVTADMPPPTIVPSLGFAKRIKRKEAKTVEIEEQLVTNWLNAKESLKVATEITDSAAAEILAELGDAEVGKCVVTTYDGNDVVLSKVETGYSVTYFQQTKNLIAAKKLKAEQPDIAAKYSYESKSRVLRHKKPKKKKGK